MVARDLPRQSGSFLAHLIARRALLYDPCRVGDFRLFGGSPMDNDTVLVRLGGLCGILFVILLVPGVFAARPDALSSIYRPQV
jgi:hypothetical protein